ncbi:DUF1829 domain-containing protein [Virgibacillus sp. MSJ-26]|uniref:DUF1829 domain-containing protein n=1 Tax=Virgibacillus sp. MSJ-26 TaxID=2841522 RepID=UPI001C0F9FE8|nr:DUF1829 domain-containing protein [Virgibacillus sp. MSJ-26]MBU5467061.1 DUF1829 domain-containing protein [Virgibacillus sp. MSJ-26]
MLKFNTSAVRNIFREEVSAYFDKNEDIYDPFSDFEIQGRSKLTHHFDYLMTLQNKEKKLVRLINNFNQPQVERTLISWQDTHEQRKNKYNENLKMVALINDNEKKLSEEYTEALLEYGIEPIRFSDKQHVKKSLSLIE